MSPTDFTGFLILGILICLFMLWIHSARFRMNEQEHREYLKKRAGIFKSFMIEKDIKKYKRGEVFTFYFTLIILAVLLLKLIF